MFSCAETGVATRVRASRPAKMILQFIVVQVQIVVPSSEVRNWITMLEDSSRMVPITVFLATC